MKIKENEREIQNWEQFEKKISEFYLKAKKFQTKPRHVSNPLFRGQSNHNWKLQTTLDRILEKITGTKDFPLSVKKYYEIIKSIDSAIESLTSNHWELQDVKTELAYFAEIQRPSTPYIQYMIYLRHHGFPSPLLDWTQSPYIAVFFAYNDAEEKDVAIYMYLELIGGGKWSSFKNHARISSIGPNVKTHKRHYLQQSEYTICTQISVETLNYVSHDKSFESNMSDEDLCEKYILPISERPIFLRKLNQMNINAYSLFGSEEGLMNSIANKEFERNNIYV